VGPEVGTQSHTSALVGRMRGPRLRAGGGYSHSHQRRSRPAFERWYFRHWGCALPVFQV